MADCYLGVDVGTGSVRTGLVKANGELLARSEEKISRKSSKPGHYEQSSQEIWSAVISTVRAVLETSNTTRDSIKGIGFDATCSLVVEDKNGVGLPVGEDQDYDIIMWCDHRASAEAQLINTTKHKVLNYVGGQVSLEMQLPKLLWLKNNNNDLWVKSGNFFDLPDWLTYKATGSDSRSFCSVVCKWNYLVESNSKVIGWDKTLFRLIGLEDLEENEWNKIGKIILNPGSPVGLGLSKQAADDLGLLEGTAIGTSLIDAHAGALGMLKGASNLVGNLGLVSGTSTCHMLLSENQNFVAGVWGPYWSAIIDGLWLMEGGQSLTGGLLDFIIQSHPAYSELVNISEPDKVYSALENRIEELRITNSLKDSSFLTKKFHMTVDFHGNRSPLADPQLTGSMVGLTVTKDLESLAVQYLATIQGVCYGTKHIIQVLLEEGHQVCNVTVCGGLTKSKLFLQTLVDVVQLPVHVPAENESVLLGASFLGMSAHKGISVKEVLKTMEKIPGVQHVIKPSQDEEVRNFHTRKYRVYRKMVDDQLEYRKMMEEGANSMNRT